MKYLFIIIITANILCAQTDWVKWEAAEPSYEIPVSQERNFRVDNSTIGSLIITGATKIYHIMVSDVDGDNCPFYPSCSEFFVEGVKSTNLFQGGLMFIDRFTRDINFFKSRNKYPLHVSGKLYDPVVNYTLKFHNITYIPHDHIVK